MESPSRKVIRVFEIVVPKPGGHKLVSIVKVIPESNSHLEAANRGRNLLSSDIDTSQKHRLVVGELVHRVQADVEAGVGVIDREDVDRVAVVSELPAGAALGRVPTRDRRSGADVREVGQRAEGREAFGKEAIGPVGTGDGGEALASVVVGLVVRDRDRGGSGWSCERGDSSEEESRDRGEALHYGETKTVTGSRKA